MEIIRWNSEVFTFSVCARLMFLFILLRSKEIEALELDFLLRFRVECTYKSPVDFLTTQSWSAIRAGCENCFLVDKDIELSTKRLSRETNHTEGAPSGQNDHVFYTYKNFVEEKLGSKYVEGMRMDLAKSYEESSPTTPEFFLVSRSEKLGFTIDSGRFRNISLRQEQEIVAEEAINATHGHWVLLQVKYSSVAKWLVTLEKLLEQYSEESHSDFHICISAEPAPTPEEHIIPHGILENSVKITSEPPMGMLANLHITLHSFDQDTLKLRSREREFKSILFSLCYFHTCIASRLRFGPPGWNQRYLFSTRDLTVCLNVLCNYLETHTEVRYLCFLFGEILYGGHITDAWDRSLCCIYLQESEGEKSEQGGCLITSQPQCLPYNTWSLAEQYHQYLQAVGYFQKGVEEFLTAVIANGSLCIGLEMLGNVLGDILEMLPEEFNVAEIMQNSTARSPCTLVCLQECERMNLPPMLVIVLQTKGELLFSPHMEELQSALFYDAVPDTWTKLAPICRSFCCFSVRVTDLLWYGKLDVWTQDLVLPAVVWLSGLFNPRSFLTGNMASKNNLTLDKVCARWDIQLETVAEILLRELNPAMPVIFVRTMPLDQRETKDVYERPIYKSKNIWTFKLRSKEKPAK
uniref:Uncharacterized protein n=1 Tax=Anser cygnoides TaxID=8845 RepID=A0A8B9E943_ANSCY